MRPCIKNDAACEEFLHVVAGPANMWGLGPHLLSSSCHVALPLGGGCGRPSSSSPSAAACSMSAAWPKAQLRSRQRAQRLTRAPTCPDSM